MDQNAPFIVGYGFCVIIAWVIGASKGQAAGGFIFGLLFGPLGILFAAFGLKPSVNIQAQRDLAVEAEKDRLRGERERLRAEVRAEMEAEQRAGQPYTTEIGRPPGAE